MQLLTPAQVAELLQKSVKTLAKWRCEGGGPKFYKIAGSIRYRREDIEDFIGKPFTSTSEVSA